LVRRASGDQHRITFTLCDRPRLHAVLLEEALAHIFIQVHGLVVDRVVSGWQGLAVLVQHFVDKVSDLVDVVRMEDVPESTQLALVSSYPLQLGDMVLSDMFY